MGVFGIFGGAGEVYRAAFGPLDGGGSLPYAVWLEHHEDKRRLVAWCKSQELAHGGALLIADMPLPVVDLLWSHSSEIS